MANTTLMWQQGGPYLNYMHGDKCNDNQYRQTFIAFLCGPEGSSNDPIIIEENPCQLIIHWNLNLVCEKRVSNKSQIVYEVKYINSQYSVTF